jgi:hypothetical protein
MTWEDDARQADEQKEREQHEAAESKHRYEERQRRIVAAQENFRRNNPPLPVSAILGPIFFIAGVLFVVISYRAAPSNVERLQQRQNEIIIGCTLVIVGTLCTLNASNTRRPTQPPPPAPPLPPPADGAADANDSLPKKNGRKKGVKSAFDQGSTDRDPS